MKRLLVLSIALSAALAACKKDETSNEPAKTAPAPVKPAPAPTPTPTPTPTTPAAPAISDAQIAQIVVTANTIDINAGKAAQAKTKNDEVAKFAATMVTDHTHINEAATALVTKLGVTPEPSDTSKALDSAAADTAKKLDALTGADFDKAYVANEIAYHQQVLDALDKVLIPGAQNADLKAALQGARPVVAEHLDHAKMIASSLK